MTKDRKVFYMAAFAMLFLAGCATFRSNLIGAYDREVGRNSDSKPVNVLFLFTHVRQTLGYDAIPKVVGKTSLIPSFDNVFQDALREFSNLGKYSTFTNEASDVNHPERRATRDSLIAQSDYAVRIRIVAEKRFAPFYLGVLLSTASMTVIPVPYRQTYRMETEVFDRDGRLVNSYSRKAHLSTWVETLLVLAYPFCPEERKREEIFVAMLHDTFKQMESERVLIIR